MKKVELDKKRVLCLPPTCKTYNWDVDSFLNFILLRDDVVQIPNFAQIWK